MTTWLTGLHVLAIAGLGLVSGQGSARAETALVAVATNFVPLAEEFASDYAAGSGHQIIITGGSTGKLYAQITEGAPFDVLLSADAAIPARLLAEGLAVPDSGFTYATGQLALWSADPARIGADGSDAVDGVAALSDPDLRFVAIANPALAPYGVAAQETLVALGLWDSLQAKLVRGQNVGQAFALVDSGAAEVGFVALSAVLADGVGGSHWRVPADLHAPIRQDAVLLDHGSGNLAAQGFLDYLRTTQVRGSIAAAGYLTDD